MNTGVIYCAAIPILIISAGMFISNILFTLRAEKTTGTVVDYRSKRGSKGGVTHAEIVEFQADGKTIQFVEKAYRSRFIMNTGHTVNVLYDPNQPEKARINSFGTLYLVPIILLFIGIGLVLFNMPMFNGIMQMLLDFLMNLIDKLPSWL
jgi:Protein of unknown function (DUF3592)